MQSSVSSANAKLAIFFDYLGYESDDSSMIMNIG